MIIKTGRFGQVTIQESEIIKIPQGILGFPEFTEFCLIDSADDTLILWLQSIRSADVAFPVLEPKIFRPEYFVNLSAADMRELKMQDLSKAAIFSLLTIPDDVTQMTANLKAPLVINLTNQAAKQIVLQENEFGIKQPMFKELRTHLITIESQKRAAQAAALAREETATAAGAVSIKSLPPSRGLKSLSVV